MEFFLHGMENVRYVFDVDNVAMGIEHLDESTHVSAFKFLGQIDEHADGSDRILHRPGLVPNLDGEAQTAHAHFIHA